MDTRVITPVPRRIPAPHTETRYYTPEEAAEELNNRKSIIKDVMWFGIESGFSAYATEYPTVIQSPAVLARQLATFRYEDAAFVLLAERAGLTPVWLSYNGDKFYTGSNLKRSYVHPVFSTGAGRNGGLRTFKQKLADPKACTGVPLDQIKVAGGQGLAEYHNAHQDKVYPGAIRRDNTSRLKMFGNPKGYYLYFLSMFIANAVLFEDYHGGESGGVLDDFTTEVFQPAYNLIFEYFGLHPLIVKMPWTPEMKFYPADANWRNHGIRLV